MFLTIYKLESRVKKLGELRYDGMESLFPLMAYDDVRNEDEIVAYPPQIKEGFTIHKDDFIVGRDRYFWAGFDGKIPPQREGFDSIGYFNFGETNMWFNSGFESLLHINGKEYQGVDSYHNEVYFPKEMAGTTQRFDFMFWSGLEGGGEHTDQVMRANRAELGYIHRDTDALYYLCREALGAYHIMGTDSNARDRLLMALNRAFLTFDLYGKREDFYKQTSAALVQLEEDLKEIGESTDVTIHCIGHSHIDLGWLWRVKHTHEKGARSFSTVMRLMEQYPEYIFLQSQPQLYEFMKNAYPEVYAQMKKRVAEGRFEPNGGMWVEADCNLISGESMVRQFLYGDKFIKEEFGMCSDVLWLPDVFGYSQAMPQVLKQCDIDTFMTTKISWNEVNSIPHDTFMWRGIDGSEVLTHFITAPSPNCPDHYTHFTYNGLISSKSMVDTFKKYKDKELTRDLPVSFGYGDGGGGPTKDMLMSMRAIDKIPLMPKVKTSSAGDYFKKLHADVKSSTGYLHTWVGELYFENHRGTYTSQALNKKLNRQTEYTMQKTEALAVFAGLKGGKTNKAALDTAWKALLLNQFHDIIPGSSIGEVYADSVKDYALCNEIAEKQQQDSLGYLVSPAGQYFTVFNPSGFTRQAQVLLPVTMDGFFTDEKGGRLLCEKREGGYLVSASLAPLCFTNISFTPSVARFDRGQFVCEDKTLETPYYIVNFNEKGLITRLYDKENRREVLKGFGNRLTVFEDVTIQYDAWNLDVDHLQKFETIDQLTHFSIQADSPLSAQVSLGFAYGDSTIAQKITFYSDSRRIDFVTEADWHEKHRFVKAMFDVNVFASKATYDIQFGNVERPNHYTTSWDWAKFEVCAHKWCDMSENGYGVAILNDCKYGHSVKDSLMAISLIKCASWPDPKADEGHHSFTYALLPHKGDWRYGQVEQEGQNMNLAPLVTEGKGDTRRLFYIDNPAVTIDTVKPAEDGKSIILRIHEYQGGTEDFTICSDFTIGDMKRVNMLEKVLEDCSPEDSITPYEIKNYAIILED